jgi:hypothetical protein
MFRQMFQVTSGKTASGDFGDVDVSRSALDDLAVARWAPTALGVAAVALALGAVHLEYAAGHDLLGRTQASAAGMPGAALSVRADDSTAAGVNRAAKADREPVVRHPGGVTLSFKVPGVDGVSVATRMPAGDAADALRKAPATLRGPAAAQPATIACEPVVSVLTAVAKQLEPGRCVT